MELKVLASKGQFEIWLTTPKANGTLDWKLQYRSDSLDHIEGKLRELKATLLGA